MPGDAEYQRICLLELRNEYDSFAEPDTLWSHSPRIPLASRRWLCRHRFDLSLGPGRFLPQSSGHCTGSIASGPQTATLLCEGQVLHFPVHVRRTEPGRSLGPETRIG